MAKHLFVVITRMHIATEKKGTADDEYTHEWRRGVNEEHKYFTRTSCDVVVIHGYFEKYKKSETRKEVVADEIAAVIQHYGLKLDDYDQRKLYVLYHAMPRFTLSANDLTPVFGERPIIVAKYSSERNDDAGKKGPGVNGALEQLGVSPEIIGEVESCKSNDQNVITQSEPDVANRSIGEEFSHLKHQIGHLFLPLSIDLQGIELADHAAQLTYAKEILDERDAQGKSLVQRFSELRFLVAQVDDGRGKARAGHAKLRSIWEWLGPYGLQESKSASDLLSLSGMVLKDDRPTVDDNSKVSKYFADLDGVTEPAQLMRAVTAKIVLRNNGQSAVENITFHEWLHKLDKVLDELRTMLLERTAEQQQAIEIAG